MDTSEDILLAKSAGKIVKGHENIQGMLVIRETWLKWEPEDKGSADSVSLSISSIKKKQQVTGKPFLRIVSDASPLGLAFQSEQDKEEVLELLKPRDSARKDASSLVPGPAERGALFASFKDLKAVYNQLVPTGILTEAEFWESHDERKNRGKIVHQLGQRLGLPSVMHEVEKLHDGKTERVNIHLKPQDIQRIFQDKPEVSRAFTSYVPHAMTEQEFWQEYFKLEYKRAARRKKAASSMGFSEEHLHDEGDIFAPFRQYALEEEKRLSKSKLEKVDPTLNLMAEYGERWSGGSRVLGCDQVRSAEVGALEKMEVAKAKPGKGAAFSFLANEINRHASHVLDGSLEVLSDTVAQGDVSSANLAASIEAARKKCSTIEDSELELKKEIWKSRASSGLQDLSQKPKIDPAPLSIYDKSAFSQIPNGSNHAHGNQLNSSCQILSHIDSGSLLDQTEIEHEKCIQVLEEFATADHEIKAKAFTSLDYLSSNTSSEETMGSVMSDFFRLEALKTNELLRHVWSCFPLNTELSKSKASRLVKHLTRQKEGLLAHMRSQTGGQLQVCISKAVAPLVDAIDATMEAYKSAMKMSL